MKKLMAGAAGKPGSEDVVLGQQSDTEAYHGRFVKAREFTQRAIDSARHNGDLETAAFYQVESALREAAVGNSELARKDVTAALALASTRDVQTLGALALAQSGDAAHAQAMADDLGQRFPADTLLNSYWLPTIHAELAIQQKNGASAVQVINAASRYELGSPQPFQLGTLYPIYIRGEAYLAAGQGSAAAGEFQRIVDHRGVVLNFPLGALARLGLARARAMSGDAAGAKTAYQEFFAVWKDADADLPVLTVAKAEYGKL
jgi:hypothetical protein